MFDFAFVALDFKIVEKLFDVFGFLEILDLWE